MPRTAAASGQPSTTEGDGEIPSRPRGTPALRPVLTPEELLQAARQVRHQIVAHMAATGSSRPADSLSAVEIVTSLFFRVMRHNPAAPSWPDRDRFVLSYGRSPALLYAALAASGYFPDGQWPLPSALHPGPGHAGLLGVDQMAVSPGQALSLGNGMALAGRLSRRYYRVFVLLNEQECLEGQVWEAALAAAHQQLGNVVAVVDLPHAEITARRLQGSLTKKWQSFGWETWAVNGHDFDELLGAFAQAEKTAGRPSVILARTVPGRGVSFLENRRDLVSQVPCAEELARALEELL